MKKVSIVVLNYKNYADTLKCLDSLFKVTYPHKEIIVVDNDSQNNSLAIISEYLKEKKHTFSEIDSTQHAAISKIAENIILFQSPSNRGYAAGNNWGIKVALARQADYVLILNNDTEVHPDFLEPLVQFAETSGRIAAVGPKILDLKGNIDRTCARKRPTYWEYFFILGLISLIVKNNWAQKNHFYKKDYFFDKPKQVDILSGSCMMLKRSLFDIIEKLDEGTFLNLEELILCEQLRDHQLESFIIPDSVIIHKHGGAVGKEPSKTMRRVTRRSRRYYFLNYRHWNYVQREVLMFEISWLIDSCIWVKKQVKKIMKY
jgi:GT2 family glycosyltransferase